MNTIDLFQNHKINLDGILCILDTYKLLKLYDLIVKYIRIFFVNVRTSQFIKTKFQINR